MDTQNTTAQNLILAAENVEPFKKAIEHDIHKAVNAYKQVFPVDGKVPELCTTIKFLRNGSVLNTLTAACWLRNGLNA